MKNSILLKSLLFSALIFCFKEAEAQLASDTPAQVVNKDLVNTKQDSINIAKGLASATPSTIKSTPKAKKSKTSSEKLTLPSEYVSNEENAKKSPIK